VPIVAFLKTRGEAAVTKIAGLSDTGDTPGVYAAYLDLKGLHTWKIRFVKSKPSQALTTRIGGIGCD
jgi:hypothetical protein